MAKLSANGEEVARYEKNNTRYSLRSNGCVLVSYRIWGKWETWKHCGGEKKHYNIVREIRNLESMGFIKK